jgi:DnaD/phage-associated family protein
MLFLNSPLGRASAEAFSHGDWELESGGGAAAPRERPNLFRLYEENIGPLTPLIADMLKEAESTYPPEWLEEGITIAVANNKRSWKYVEAILKRWKEEGSYGKEAGQDAVKGTERYTNSEFSEFIQGE